MSSTYLSADGLAIHLHKWPSEQPKGLLLIVHGMCEHGGRYAELGAFLQARGLSVWSYDQRGHGLTASSPHKPVHLDPGLGREYLVEDCRQIALQLKQTHPDRPLFLMGHSFGSMVACNVVQDHPELVDGLVLSALPEYNALLTSAGKGIANMLSAVSSNEKAAHIHMKLSFDLYNRAFRPNRTAYDWISSDPAKVDAYIADPYCGQEASVGFFQVVLEVQTRTHDAHHWRAVPLMLKALAFAGAHDAAAGKKKGFLRSMKLFSGLFPSLHYRVFPEARHEVLFDKQHAEVWDWIADNLDTWSE